MRKSPTATTTPASLFTSGSGSKDPSSVNIKVACRCRPPNAGDLISDTPRTVTVDKVGQKVSVLVKNNDKKDFSFDKVYDGSATQETIYNEIAAPIVEEVLNGYTCTIFAYGQTGTGKTYTMEGDTTDLGIVDDAGLTVLPEAAGIIPRVVNHIFDRLGTIDGAGFSVHVSHLELYNETICDLLSNDDEREVRIMTAHVPPAAGKRAADTRDTVILAGVEKVLVRNAAETLELMKKGMRKRTTAATLANKKSSRSHCVFIIYVVVTQVIDGESVLLTGKLNLVDLAGSENMEKADTSGNEKRKKETQNINKSLFNLGKVIDLLVKGEAFIPYRDSKLTRLLQDSLGGKTKTWIIATISPDAASITETIGTLRYGSRARFIKNTPVQNTQNINNDVIKSYEQRIALLKNEIKAQRAKDGCVYLDTGEYDRMTEDLRAKEERLAELEATLDAARKELDEVRDVLSRTRTRAESAEQQCRQSQAELRHTRDVLDEAGYWLRDARDKVSRQSAVIAQKEQTEAELRAAAQTIMGDYPAAVAHVEALYAKLDRVAKVNEENGRRAEEFRGGLEAAAHAAAAATARFADDNARALDALKRLFDDFAGARFREFDAAAAAARDLSASLARLTPRVLDSAECTAADGAVAAAGKALVAAQRDRGAAALGALAAGRAQATALAERLSAAVLGYSERLNAVQDALAAAAADIVAANARRAEAVKAQCSALVAAAAKGSAAHSEQSKAAAQSVAALQDAQQRATAAFKESCLKILAEQFAAFEARQTELAKEAAAATGGHMDAAAAAVAEMVGGARAAAAAVGAAEETAQQELGTACDALKNGFAEERAQRSAFSDSALGIAAEGKTAVGQLCDTLEAAVAAGNEAAATGVGNMEAKYAAMLDARRAACREGADAACAALGVMEKAAVASGAACGGEEPKNIIQSINTLTRLPGPAIAEVQDRFNAVQKSACGLLYYKTAVPTGETPLKRQYSKDAFGAFLRPQKKARRETPVKFPRDLMPQNDQEDGNEGEEGGGGSAALSLGDNVDQQQLQHSQLSSSSLSSTPALSPQTPQKNISSQQQQQQQRMRRQSQLLSQQQQQQLPPPPLPPPIGGNVHENSRKSSMIIPTISGSSGGTTAQAIVSIPGTRGGGGSGGGSGSGGVGVGGVVVAGRRSSKMPTDTGNNAKQRKGRRPSKDIK